MSLFLRHSIECVINIYFDISVVVTWINKLVLTYQTSSLIIKLYRSLILVIDFSTSFLPLILRDLSKNTFQSWRPIIAWLFNRTFKMSLNSMSICSKIFMKWQKWLDSQLVLVSHSRSLIVGLACNNCRTQSRDFATFCHLPEEKWYIFTASSFFENEL